VQGRNAPLSILHSKVEPASVDEKANAAEVELVGFCGYESMLVSGVVVSAVGAGVFSLPWQPKMGSLSAWVSIAEDAAKPG
jgi:hypothetical protein